MKKKLLTLSIVAASISVSAQILTHVDNTALFYVGEGALVYNGGGLQTKGSGIVDLHGNMMIVGNASDVLQTVTTANTAKLDGGNIVLRFNSPGSIATSTYGQLYIAGITQPNISGIVSKEYLTAKHGNGNFYQQIALPFADKPLNSLSAEFGKTFNTTRYSKNEILKWNNTQVVSDNVGPLSTLTSDRTGYYMLGSLNNNLNTAVPPASLPTVAPTPTGAVYTLNGMPYADGFIGGPILGSMMNAGAGLNYGTNGFGVNGYNEYYNSYLQDQFEATASPWTGTFGKNIYQFGNPFFTNLDLSKIGYTETGGVNDDNQIPNLWGVRYSPGTVVSLNTGSTYSVGAQIQTYFNGSGLPVGDIGLIIKPMQTFVVKLRTSVPVPDLKFNKLRRFKDFIRPDGTSYSVTAKSSSSTGTAKQIGVIALNSAGEEIGRTYYVVCETCTTGHQTSTATSVQAASGAGVIKSFEEDPVNGMFDNNYLNYALYINEANENDFQGKPIPVALYSSDISSLKFEIRENAVEIPDAQQNLSTGIGFYYRTTNGNSMPISQNMTIPTNGENLYGLSYGPMNSSVLGTAESLTTNTTIVVYNDAIDNYIVQFDSRWKTADIQVYDMSGKLVISAKNVKTSQDFVINLSNKIQGTYIVTGINEKGEKFTSKIIR